MYPRSDLRRVRLAAVPAILLLLPAAVSAQVITTNSSGSRVQDLQVSFQPGEFVGHGRVLREFIKIGTNEFLFVVPEGSRPETLKGDALVVTSRDSTYYLTFRMAGSLAAEGDLNQSLKCRVADQYPNARNVEPFSTTVANRVGEGLSLKQGRPGVGSRFIKVLWVPSKAGVLEFTLNTDSTNAPAAELAFSSMLLTFRSNERGKLEIVRRSERT
jgi:hypothetical protein